MAPDNSVPSHEPEYVPLKVTAGILMHIGAGIYSSVAGAIKELVSNSFDADATQVSINMDYPVFEEIKVVDNGNGMSKERFKQAMQTIGSSLKRTLEVRERTRKYKRPVIGHLGIGLMALSQVCGKAEIESQEEGSDTKFLATLDFGEFQEREEEQKEEAVISVLEDQQESKEYLEKLLRDRQIDRNAKTNIRSQRGAARKLGKEELGYCLIYPKLPAVLGEHGTVITLRDIRTGVKNLLSDDGRNTGIIPKQFKGHSGWLEYRDNLGKLDWHELCQHLRIASAQFTVQNLPMYYQFLWELSLMTPVKYFPGTPITIRKGIFKDDRERLEQYGFSLRVDSRELFKPILLPSGNLTKTPEKLQPRFDYNVETIAFDQKVDGRRLKYHGYIYWQRTQIEPNTLRGIEIYIRNVGIGVYDYTLLNYSTRNPAHRAGQVSGEIYVEEGLETALNIDRNSFRKSDSHYLALQNEIWELLGSGARLDGIFGRSVDSYYLRKERDEEIEEKEHIKELRERVEVISNSRLKISFSNRIHSEPYTIEDDQITIFDDSKQWPRGKSQRHLYQKILITMEAAIARGARPKEILDEVKNILLNNS